MLDNFTEVFANLDVILMSLAYVILFSYHIWNIFNKGSGFELSYFAYAFLVILLIAYLPDMYVGLSELSFAIGTALQPKGSGTTYEFFSQYATQASEYGADAWATDVSAKFAHLIWLFCAQVVYLINSGFDFVVAFMTKIFAPIAGLLVVLAHFSMFKSKSVSGILFFCQIVLWPIGWGVAEAIINIILPIDPNSLQSIETLATYGLIKTIWMCVFTWYVPKFFMMIFSAGMVGGMAGGMAGSAGAVGSAGAAAGAAAAAAGRAGKSGAYLADNLSKGKVGKAVEASRKLRTAIRSPLANSYKTNQIRKGKVVTSPPPKKQALVMDFITGSGGTGGQTS